MAKAIFAFFEKNNPMQSSASSMDDLKFEDAVPIIQKTWRELMKDKTNVGAKIYDFILHKEITMSRLFIQSNIEQQSDIFMVMMDKVVSFLDDPLTLDDKLLELGEIHATKYNVKTKHFKHFRSAFLKAIKKYLPWTDRREQAWQWFWSRIINQMSHATQANHFPLINQYNGRQLSREQMVSYAKCIHDSFDSALSSDPKQFADRFYQNLLEAQPDIAKLFKGTSFATQSARFIAMLNHAIKLLDDTSTFTTKLELLSAEHVAYGVQIPMLQSFGEVLIAEVKNVNAEYYGRQEENKNNKTMDTNATIELMQIPQWTNQYDEAWDWFWRIVVAVFSTGMTKKIEELKQQSQKPLPSKQEIENEDFSSI